MSSIIARLLLLAASATPALSFCGAHTHLDRRQEGEVEVNQFGYAGTIGPLLWTSLDPQVNSACSTGTRQSPIDMVAGQFNMMPGDGIGLTIPDVPQGAEFENLGTTVEVIMEGLGGRLTMSDGTAYNLSQFHFHHPSEHIDNGISMPMEMHMVFQSEANEVAVIGIYIDIEDPSAAACDGGSGSNTLGEGYNAVLAAHNKLHRRAPSSLLETVFASVEQIAEPGSHTTTAPLAMSEVVDTLTAGNFQAYSGSLTTPPCSEGVSWFVSTQKLTISASTFIKARNVLGFNSRYPQNNPGQPNLFQMAAKA
ncbi:hypothetical protein DL766_003665 [Monosporascus sp. MC13-8B]|uniref:carbonic anhydrase n=1 Tax=Monosporascus cannonballus TaxID=155416 RepID=A0ABY0H3B2_9PEZI|nr:hypothetical protein DL762_005980 [Monosporascus cannonballus]RYO93638.1 hypothetical protein DL763_004313 [Monosporascus cannonballus]RYP33072.1 hypothetical protein DL766_003665 [Monosporascus sp. MC13-8B]